MLLLNTHQSVLCAGYQYPVYGVQWHPEKAPYEWGKLKGISHAPNAVRAAFYLAEFFVAEGNMGQGLQFCLSSVVLKEIALI